MQQKSFPMRAEIFSLFDLMYQEAKEELYRVTLTMPLDIAHKADTTVVTACDSAIDECTSGIAALHGFSVLSEEGVQSDEIVCAGTYCAIDPIDGTREYIESVNDAIADGGVLCFLESPRSKKRNFCFLVGLVENGMPTYGACYNYVTGEQILIDANAPHLARLNAPALSREDMCHNSDPIVYTDPRVFSDPRYGPRLQKIVQQVPGTRVIAQGSFGLNAVHALLNGHQDALVFHPVQQSGLWDVLPAAVAARAFGGEIFDGQGKPLKLDSYVLVPGLGLYVLKGDKFRFVIDEI